MFPHTKVLSEGEVNTFVIIFVHFLFCHRELETGYFCERSPLDSGIRRLGSPGASAEVLTSVPLTAMRGVSKRERGKILGMNWLYPLMAVRGC